MAYHKEVYNAGVTGPNFKKIIKISDDEGRSVLLTEEALKEMEEGDLSSLILLDMMERRK